MSSSFVDLRGSVTEEVVGEQVAERAWHVTSEEWIDCPRCANSSVLKIIAELVFIWVSKGNCLEWSKLSLVNSDFCLG